MSMISRKLRTLPIPQPECFISYKPAEIAFAYPSERIDCKQHGPKERLRQASCFRKERIGNRNRREHQSRVEIEHNRQ